VSTAAKRQTLWSRHQNEWRDPLQVISFWKDAADVDASLLEYRVRGAFWETLARLGVTLLVTREYEHLLMAMRAGEDGPRLSYLRLPHPSGIVVDRAQSRAFIASTRNPNQIYELQPVQSLLPRLDMPLPPFIDRPLLPAASRFLPGSMYIHDLALIGEQLYANAVAHNAVVRIHPEGNVEYAWWPRCIDGPQGPMFGRNHLQLNSIAAGSTLARSFFSASTDRVSMRRPGHHNFPVDGQGVIFSGKTREPLVRGLTRPHSARLHREELWVDNSGYGELGRAVKGRYEAVVRLPGWTRGLCFAGEVAFVGTSRVLPRFRQYAPGLDVDRSRCGVAAVDVKTGAILGSLVWPNGNQIFALDWMPTTSATGLPFRVGKRRALAKERALFYSFQLSGTLRRRTRLSSRPRKR
jgi:uncharacterized protein (TIGR03032 family)